VAGVGDVWREFMTSSIHPPVSLALAAVSDDDALLPVHTHSGTRVARPRRTTPKNRTGGPPHMEKTGERRDTPLAKRREGCLLLMIFIGAPRTRDSILSGKRRFGNKFLAPRQQKSYLGRKKLCSATALHNL
jgi:hypothetical protein